MLAIKLPTKAATGKPRPQSWGDLLLDAQSNDTVELALSPTASFEMSTMWQA